MSDETNQTQPGRTFRFACPDREIPLAQALLLDQGYAFEPEPFSPLAMRLTEEPRPLGNSAANFFGLIHIQDKSSMLPPLMLGPAPGTAVLDMCASPGSKTGMLALATGPQGFVLANEPNRARLETLRRTLDRVNATACGTCSYPGQNLPLPENSWPAILLDPPCSGLGTLEKHPEARRWQGEKAKPLVSLQRELLTHAAHLLAPGGTLLYSTCTTNPEENELQTAWALENLPLTLEPLTAPPGFTPQTPTNNLTGTLPINGEASGSQGFFLAKFQKPGTPATPGHYPQPTKGRPLSTAEQDQCATAGADLHQLPGTPLRFGDTLFLAQTLSNTLMPSDFPWQGTPLGRFQKNRFKPNPRLRPLLPTNPSSHIHVDSINDLERLLAGQPLPAPSTPHATLIYKDFPLCRLTVKGKRAIWGEK